MKSIKNFMLPEHTNGLYKNEAISSISLTKEVAEKINELVDAYNEFSKTDLEWKQEQDGRTRKAVLYMRDNLINSLNELLDGLITEGFVDERIAKNFIALSERIDNLVNGVSSESEIIDARVDLYGRAHTILRNILNNIEMLQRVNEVKVEWEKGYFIRNTGATNVDSAWMISKPIQIVGSYLAFKGYNIETRNSNSPFITFYNCDRIGTSTKVGEFKITDSKTEYDVTNIVIPEGAKYFVMSVLDKSTMIQVYTGINETLGSKLHGLDVVKSGFDKMYKINPVYNEGYYITPIGTISTINMYRYSNLIPIRNGGRLYINGAVKKHSGTGTIMFFNSPTISQTSFVGSYQPDTDLMYMDSEIVVPAGAKYFSINENMDYSGLAEYYQFVDVENHFTRIQDVMSKIVLNDGIQIKLIGDSITHGYGGTGFTNDSSNGEQIISGYYVNTNGHCWANSLKDYLSEKFGCVVKNYGTTGRASGHLVLNLSSLIEPEDDIVICMIGTNDRNNETEPTDTSKTRSLALTYKNMQTIHDYVKGLGKDIIFMSSIPASVSNETDGKLSHMEDIDNIIMKLAGVNNMEYISLYKLFTEYCEVRDITIDSLLADGLHPNDNGYDVMFYLITNALGIGTKRTGATW